MDLGTTLAVFVLVATALLLSFCLLLKYYSHKLKKQRREAVNINAMEDSLYRSTESIVEGAYEEFIERRRLKKSNEMKQMSFLEDKIIQNSEIRQVLDISNNIYGMSKLRQNLHNQIPPIYPETNRSMASVKSFNISRLNTTQSQKKRAFYSFVHKIVGYSEKGLNVVEAGVKGIRKAGESYELVREDDMSFIQEPSQKDFCEQLEAYGFYPLAYGYHKYVKSVDVTDLKDTETVPIKTLKAHSNKQVINMEEFQKIKQLIRAHKS